MTVGHIRNTDTKGLTKNILLDMNKWRIMIHVFNQWNSLFYSCSLPHYLIRSSMHLSHL